MDSKMKNANPRLSVNLEWMKRREKGSLLDVVRVLRHLLLSSRPELRPRSLFFTACYKSILPGQT